MTLRKICLAGAAGALGVMFGATGAMANLIVGGPGDPGTGNCFPFGCSIWGPQYQQVYASGDFSSSITIHDLVFYNFNSPGGSPDGGTFTIDLSVTSAAVDGLDTVNLSNNIGTNDVLVFSGALPALSGGELIIPLSTPYTYNPADGNLLMNITGVGLSDGSLYLDADFGDAAGLFSRAISCQPPACFGTSDYGLVTGFTTGAPEPATWAVMLAGFGMLGAAMRVSRRKGFRAAA